MNALRQLTAILVLPFAVTVVIPATALVWRGAPYVRVESLVALVAAVCALVPLAFVVWTIGLFAVTGNGTLAPWMPTTRLVARGPYRYVRNPMIMGVAGILLAEAIVAQSGFVAAELALFVLANTTYIPIVEERGLLARFGEDYAKYARNVPRWSPRLTAWTGRDDGIPRRAPDDLILVTVPAEQARGLAAMHVLASVSLVGLATLVVWSAFTGTPGLQWLLGALAGTWGVLDLRDAWVDALRDAPPSLVFGRLHQDGTTFELREKPGGRPVAGWRFVRRDNGAFVLMRRRLASRALIKRFRPKDRAFRRAILYEPRGRPDAEGWIRYPASAAWEDPPGAWRPIPA